MCNEIEEKINLCDHSIEHLYEFDFVPVNERQNENRYPLESRIPKQLVDISQYLRFYIS